MRKQVSVLLARLGIDARRYWLLVDLFNTLSERGEVLDQLGRNGVALRAVAWLYAALFALMAIFMAAMGRVSVADYSCIFLGFTAFIVLSVLLLETGNSLVNPVEALVLAHQPVDGATYTAAKLSHLVRIVLMLVPAMNAVPAVAGLALNRARWFYPVVHLTNALVLGFLVALLCCALYGWLIRLVPTGRLKAAGQIAGTVPMFGFFLWQPIRDGLRHSGIVLRLPASEAARWALGASASALGLAIVVLGIRALSADYLLRVSGIVHGRTRAVAARNSLTGAVVARLAGGQPARAGFAYVCKMARRDYQFRRQALPVLLLPLGVIPLVSQTWRTDPFSGTFSVAGVLPHVLGVMSFFACALLPYGADYKAAWLFLLAPVRVFGGFARGVWSALWLQMVLIPHGVMLGVFGWAWGPWRAALFVAYSAVVCSVYLALQLHGIDGVPFTRQPDPTRGASMLPLMILGGAVMALAVAVQHFVVFRSVVVTAAATAALGAGAWWLTGRLLRALTASLRCSIAVLAEESGSLYKEIDL